MPRAEGDESRRSGIPALSDLFFAYGADMDPEVARERGCVAQTVEVACLPDFRLGFFGYAWIWDGGYDTVVEDPGSKVWGVLYRPTQSDWDALDGWMGARLDGGGMYFHFPAVVTTSDGTRHHVRLYKKDILGHPTKPSDAYLRLLLRGAGQRGLPDSYLEQLRAMETRRADPSVPRIGNPRRGKDVPVDCRQCSHAETGETP